MSWDELRETFSEAAAAGIEQTVPRDSPHFPQQCAFAVGRLEEGRQVGEYLLNRFERRPLRVLDLGAGNGGVALALANFDGISAHGVDIVPNATFRRLRRQTKLDCSQVIGSAHDLPYRSGAFDAVVCLDTLEHVPDAAALGREVMRVLRPGGLCMLTTPARLKYLLRPDPHFGIRGLMLLPDGLQRHVVTSLRHPREYDVVHIFWRLQGIVGLFPGAVGVEPMFNNPRPPNTLWWRFRNWLWDRIVLLKPASP